MAETGAYCKAYPAGRMRAFPGWSAADVADDVVLYLHDDYVVTRGIFKDEQIVFADPSDPWRDFCRSALEFCVPDYCRTSPCDRRSS